MKSISRHIHPVATVGVQCRIVTRNQYELVIEPSGYGLFYHALGLQIGVAARNDIVDNRRTIIGEFRPI